MRIPGPNSIPESYANFHSDPWAREWMVWDSNLHASIGGYPNLMVPSKSTDRHPDSFKHDRDVTAKKEADC